MFPSVVPLEGRWAINSRPMQGNGPSQCGSASEADIVKLIAMPSYTVQVSCIPQGRAVSVKAWALGH